MKVKIKYKRPILGHALGFCDTCNLQFDIFHDGRKEFMKHAKLTGHKMSIETAYHQYFNMDS